MVVWGCKQHKVVVFDRDVIRTGWWLGHPAEKYESQLGLFFPIYRKIKNVPKHQPENVVPPALGGSSQLVSRDK